MQYKDEKLRLTNAGHYTNAAMLLFSKDPDKWQLGSYTKIGFFETDADLRYQDEIHGSILEQIDKIIEVLHLKFMKAKITYEGIQRIERRERSVRVKGRLDGIWQPKTCRGLNDKAKRSGMVYHFLL